MAPLTRIGKCEHKILDIIKQAITSTTDRERFNESCVFSSRNQKIKKIIVYFGAVSCNHPPPLRTKQETTEKAEDFNYSDTPKNRAPLPKTK